MTFVRRWQIYNEFNDDELSKPNDISTMARRTNARLERYVDEDTEAFTQVMQAAARLPMQVAIVCMEVLKISSSMLEIGNANEKI